MVALESPAATGLPRPTARRGGLGWTLAAGGVLVAGLALRLALGGGGVGDASASVMATLLAVGVWIAAMLLSTPRAAFLVTLGLVALIDLAALPARNASEYDERQAFFRNEQVITAQAEVPPDLVGSPAQPMLTLLVEPVFPAAAAQPRFGLAGEVGGAALIWECTFQRGLQRLALPLPPGVVASSRTLLARLHLTGSPTRESDYLLVYASALRGGFLASLGGASDVSPSATVCTLRP